MRLVEVLRQQMGSGNKTASKLPDSVKTRPFE